MRVSLYILISLIICSCAGASSVGGGLNQGDEVRYAKGFSIEHRGEVALVEITDPSGSSSTVYRYALIPRGVNDSIPKGYETIITPVDRVICMTTLQLSGFIKLGESDRVAGVTSTRFLKDESLVRRVESGELRRIGIEGEFDIETILTIDPDVIFVSPFKRGGYGMVETLPIPRVSYLGYKELSPLGQAEWIKFVGLLTDRYEESKQIFSQIESRYLELMELTKGVEHRPKVLSGELHSGNWYVVGGNSYLAHLFRDAGGEYFMINDSESGGFYVDFETVYSQGHDADYWRIVNSHRGEFGYDELLKSDSRYSEFKPFSDRGVFYCNLREKPFYELTPMEPEVVLSDLIYMFHRELLPDHKPVYYKAL